MSQKTKTPNLEQTRQSLPISLLRTREMVVERFRPMLAARDVTDQQWRVLRVIGETDTIDARTLAEHACILPPSLTRILKTLDRQGYIQQIKDSNDKRRLLVSMTPSGRQFIEDSAMESAAIYGDIERAIGRETMQSLMRTLIEVRQKLSKQTNEGSDNARD